MFSSLIYRKKRHFSGDKKRADVSLEMPARFCSLCLCFSFSCFFFRFYAFSHNAVSRCRYQDTH